MKPSPSEALSIVVPMFNEEGNVVGLLTEIAEVLSSHANHEIIVVEDGSTDGTLTELVKLLDQLPQLRIIQHDNNYGQSAGLISGIKAAEHPWIVTLDGDGQNDPTDIPHFITTAEKSGLYLDTPLLIIGHRTKRKDNTWKRFGSKLANFIRQCLLKDNCPDTGCGIKLFDRNTFLELPHFNHIHRYLPALFKCVKSSIINLPVNHRERKCGQSKYGNWNRLKVGITDLIGVSWLIRRSCQPKTHEHLPCPDKNAKN